MKMYEHREKKAMNFTSAFRHDGDPKQFPKKKAKRKRKKKPQTQHCTDSATGINVLEKKSNSNETDKIVVDEDRDINSYLTFF